MFVYNINKRSLPCLILLLLFNSLWMKFKLLTKALWDLVPASVKPPLSICSHCCLNHMSPQCRELWGTAHRSWLRTFECARRLCFVPVPTLRHILALFSACSDPFHLPGFPQCSHLHHLIFQSGRHLFLPEDALHIVIICCLLLYKLSLFTRLMHLGRRDYTVSYLVNMSSP